MFETKKSKEELNNKENRARFYASSKYFKAEEFNCKCGCDRNTMKLALLNRLEEAREKAGVPFRITSGCRCSGHNKRIGGVKGSAHVEGKAVDIWVRSNKMRFRIITGLLLAGFERIGIHKSFIHADVATERSVGATMYLYGKKGL